MTDSLSVKDEAQHRPPIRTEAIAADESSALRAAFSLNSPSACNQPTWGTGSSHRRSDDSEDKRSACGRDPQSNSDNASEIKDSFFSHRLIAWRNSYTQKTAGLSMGNESFWKHEHSPGKQSVSEEEESLRLTTDRVIHAFVQRKNYKL